MLVFVLLKNLILLIYVNLLKVELLISIKNLSIVMQVLKFWQVVVINLVGGSVFAKTTVMRHPVNIYLVCGKMSLRF